MRDARLWLFGNSSDRETHPYPIELSRGLVVIPKDDNSINLLPVLGMNPLIDAGLRIELDAERQKFCVDSAKEALNALAPQHL